MHFAGIGGGWQEAWIDKIVDLLDQLIDSFSFVCFSLKESKNVGNPSWPVSRHKQWNQHLSSSSLLLTNKPGPLMGPTYKYTHIISFQTSSCTWMKHRKNLLIHNTAPCSSRLLYSQLDTKQIGWSQTNQTQHWDTHPWKLTLPFLCE